MRKGLLNLLIVLSSVSLLFIGVAGVFVYVIIGDVYAGEPALQYLNLALVLYPMNVVPAFAVGVAVIVFAVKARKINDAHNGVVALVASLFKVLSILFTVQGVFTFTSVTFIAFLENIGPPFLILVTWFITFISLTLALLFRVLYVMIAKVAAEKTLASVK